MNDRDLLTIVCKTFRGWIINWWIDNYADDTIHAM